jgi:hypothetical protein
MMQLLKFKILILMFIGAAILRGQHSTVFNPPKLLLKFNLTSVVDASGPTTAVAIDYRLAARHRIEHEAGYVYASPLNLSKGFNGWRLRTSYRYCKPLGQMNFLYFGIQGTFKKLNGDIEAFVKRDNGQYQQNIRFNNALHTFGLNALIGSTRFWGTTKRWVLDYQIGLGRRWTTFNYKNLPADALPPKFSVLIQPSNTTATNGSTISQITAHFAWKIGYVLW